MEGVSGTPTFVVKLQAAPTAYDSAHALDAVSGRQGRTMRSASPAATAGLIYSDRKAQMHKIGGPAPLDGPTEPLFPRIGGG